MKKVLSIIFFLLLPVFLVSCRKNTNKTFIVSFYDEGILVDKQTVSYDELLVEPELNERLGYRFDGWFLDTDFNEQWLFNTAVKKQITLYAKWTITLTDEEYQTMLEIYADLEAISIFKTSNQYHLPTEGTINQSKITWKSSDSSLVFSTGRTLPLIGNQPKDVILTASATLDGLTYTKDFIFTIEPNQPPVVTSSKMIDFVNLTSEFEVEDGTLKTYFVNNGSIPYVDIESFLTLLNGFTYAEDFEYSYTDNTLRIDYQTIYEEEDEEPEVYAFYAILDFEKNTFYVDKLDFFDHYYYTTQTDYAEGITSLDSYIEEGSDITFDLNRYRIDLIIHNDNGTNTYLMPFHIANMLFTISSYYNVYYNGDAYYGVYAIPSPSPSASDEDKLAYQTIRNSSLNAENIPADLALASFDAYVFLLDYFYGLKTVHEIDTYYDLLNKNFQKFNTTSAKSLTNAVFSSILLDIDELHTSYGFAGYYNESSYNPVLQYIDQLGSRARNWYEKSYWPMNDALQVRWGNGSPRPYRFINPEKTTAVIYLDEFITASINEEKTAETDSDVYMKEVLEAIFAENPNVENIVVDLSYNMGGNLGALYRVLGYITEQPIETSYYNPTDGSNITYFSELDQEAYEDVNWFFLTSGVTFSAGNLMAAIGKHQGFATIIGTTTGGGASSITPMILTDGTFFTMSSLNVLSLRVELEDGSYRFDSIEFGIEPDYYLSITNIQTDSKILEIVNQANADKER